MFQWTGPVPSTRCQRGPGFLDFWDVGLQMEASLSAHLYTHSFHPDTVLLFFIPLDLPSCVSGLGFVMSELVSERDRRIQGTHTPDKTLIKSVDRLRAQLGKFPFWKTDVTQASRIIRLHHPPHPPPTPCWEPAFAGKCYFQKLNSPFAALVCGSFCCSGTFSNLSRWSFKRASEVARRGLGGGGGGGWSLPKR